LIRPDALMLCGFNLEGKSHLKLPSLPARLSNNETFFFVTRTSQTTTSEQPAF
jgi:hypothetical protein